MEARGENVARAFQPTGAGAGKPRLRCGGGALKVCLAVWALWLRSRGMNDPRFDLLAKNLVSFSVSLKRGERVLCDMFDVPDEMTVALVRAVRAIGAVPFVQIHHGRVSREMSMGAVACEFFNSCMALCNISLGHPCSVIY